MTQRRAGVGEGNHRDVHIGGLGDWLWGMEGGRERENERERERGKEKERGNKKYITGHTLCIYYHY